jgi:hypothetical protein
MKGLKRVLLVFASALCLCAGVATASATAEAVPVRPDPEGVPTRVSLGFLFADVSKIDDLNQEFTADIFFQMRWSDSRLALPEGVTEPVERVLPSDALWNPAPGVLNRREITFMLPDQVSVAPDGTVTYMQRVYGTFATRMDLRAFPADTQSLPIHMVSYVYSPEEVLFEIEPLSGLLEEPSAAGWDIETGEPERRPLRVGGEDQTFAAVTFRLSAERETAYYLLTMVLPLLFIGLMAWSVFWIDPSLLPPQVGISTAAVFSLIAFRFSLKLSLPRLSYLTMADWFVLAVTVLVFTAFANVIVVGRLAKTDRHELAIRIQSWGRWSYLMLLIVLALVFLT